MRIRKFTSAAAVCLYLLMPCLPGPGNVSAAAPKKTAVGAQDAVVVMETTRGTIKLQIFKGDAPITAGNFLDLVQKGFYNGMPFNRYEQGFLIQTGDPKGDLTGVYVDPQSGSERRIPLEIKQNLRHSAAGTLGMSRQSDANSASSQFYITLAPTSFLDGKYAVFGKIIDGLPVVMELRKGDKIVSAAIGK